VLLLLLELVLGFEELYEPELFMPLEALEL